MFQFYMSFIFAFFFFFFFFFFLQISGNYVRMRVTDLNICEAEISSRRTFCQVIRK